MTDLKLMGLEELQRLVIVSGQQVIERCHWLYQRTQNPIHALQAYRMSRMLKLDVPEWVFELLDQWAEALCVNPPKGGKAKIADALGLGLKGGGRSITSQTETQTRNLLIAQHVLFLRDRNPERERLDIFHEVAEKCRLSSERVSAIWYELTGETDSDP